VDDARTFAERGIEKARAAEGASGDLARLLTVAATVASLRGEYARAAELSLEIQTATRRGEGERALPRGGTLVVGMCNPAPAVEPCEVTIDEEGEVLGNVFETLVTSDERGLLLPKLAESWKVANEGRTVDVVVRAGVAFSDGAPLDAAAVKASLVNALTRRPDLALASALAGAPEPSLEVVSERCLRMRLAEPLPIVASFLTDPALAIARAAPEGGTPLGTGPFMLDRRERASIHLVRNARSWKEAARLDGVEFRTSLKAPTAAAGLRSGALDLVRDLLPEDVDELLRDPRFRVFERAHKGTSFVQLNCASGPLADRALRRALAGAVRAQDLVWGSLGRFAIPATGLLPPATLGHDPGRRLVRPSLEDVRELVRSTGLATPIPLRAAVHPVYLDRYRALTRALLAAWHDAGVEVTLATSTMDEYGDAWTRGSADLLIGRWLLDYDDPDDATYILHHSRNGSLRAWFSSPETDQLLEEARAERRLASRDALYRRFEETLIEEAAVIPLFHDVDVRAAAAGIVGARLGSAPPYVNYAELAKEAARPSAPSARKGAVLRIPIAGRVADLDPVTAWTVEQSEVIPNVFETLTRDVEGAHVMPWLASEIFSERAGTRFRFRLRPGVRFHDGRPLTARDVRFTFERLLTTEGSHRYLLQNVRGARELLSGQASELSGFTIVSPSEFVVDLEEPVSFFPVLLSDAATAVLPEGTRAIGESFRDGAVGTGPFRLVRFDPEGRVELEKHTAYWRAGFPKSEGLVFRFGVSPQEIKTEFLAGRFSLASDLAPEDVDAFRADPALAAGYRESPLLSTYFVLLNPHTGALADELVRRRASEALRWAAPSVVKRTLGRLALPATELIPPGLLGASTSEPSIPTRPYAATRTTVQVHALRAAVHPVYFGEFAGFRMELERAVEEAGFFLRCESKSLEELAALRSDPTYDLLFTRWVADYPDADTFVHGALHTTQGLWGRWAGNEALDRLASRGRAEMDPVARHSIYRQAEERLFRDATLVPLFHEQVYRFARPEVEGLRVGFTHPVVAYENLS
jgi:ABC-type transport system substrate-binding protein